MWRVTATAVMAACVLGFASMMATHSASAVENSVKIPAGAKAEIHGNTAIIRGGGGGNGVSGTYNCTCVGGAGACALQQYPNAVMCGPLGDTGCKGSCALITTTTGAAAAAPTGRSKSKSQ